MMAEQNPEELVAEKPVDTAAHKRQKPVLPPKKIRNDSYDNLIAFFVIWIVISVASWFALSNIPDIHLSNGLTILISVGIGFLATCLGKIGQMLNL